MGSGGVNNVTHRKRGLRFEKKSVSWVFASEEKGWLSELAEVPHVVGGWWNSRHRKIVHLSPYVEKPFHSKVIKSFVPELRSRKVFRVSGFLCYLYMSYEHSIFISHPCIWLSNIYIYIERERERFGLVWFVCILWHINHCFSFMPKPAYVGY